MAKFFLFLMGMSQLWGAEIGVLEHSLRRQKAKYEKMVTERLSVYDPESIELTTGLSPRKTIKNTLVFYNGYYEVKFKSKKDGLEYNCDVNVGHSFGATAKSGTGQIYLMNCNNSRDSKVFPTHVERVFLDQYPDRADTSAPIKVKSSRVVNTVTTVTLLDTWSYHLEYTDKETGERLSCSATLDYVQMPEHLVDQKMYLSGCKVVPQPRRPAVANAPSSQLVKSICIDEIYGTSKSIEKIQSTLNGMYDRFSTELDKQWTLPKKGEVECNTKSTDQFMNIARSMISLDQLKLKTPEADREGNHREKLVLTNALINQAYNRLAIQAEGENQTHLQWLSAASHSSAQVGVRLRKSFYDNMRSISSAGSGRSEIEARDKKRDSAGVLSSLAQNRLEFMKMLGQGNIDVFEDMYWQQLAAYYCGPQEAADLNKLLSENAKGTKEKEKSLHHEYLANAWELIKSGYNSNPKNDALIEMGNRQIMWIEQHDILQDSMYGTKEAKIVNSLGVLNDLATADYVKGTEGKQPLSFTDYAKKSGQKANLSDFQTRFDWMNHVITTQTDQFSRARSKGTLKSVFLPPLYDSYMLLSDYQK